MPITERALLAHNHGTGLDVAAIDYAQGAVEAIDLTVELSDADMNAIARAIAHAFVRGYDMRGAPPAPPPTAPLLSVTTPRDHAVAAAALETPDCELTVRQLMVDSLAATDYQYRRHSIRGRKAARK